jgi:predicted RNase H-like nuclease
VNTRCIIVDSAWTGRQGAICALTLRGDQTIEFKPPVLADFDEAIVFIRAQARQAAYCLVAVDQPTIVPNETGCRPVDRVVASLISYMGGGVHPANRSKHQLFGDEAPFWRFKQELAAEESPEDSRTASRGAFIIEVFPALALAGFNPAFGERLRGPKYNPANKRRFRAEDWQAVIGTVGAYAEAAELDPLATWTRELGAVPAPRKADQDKLDAALCALAGYHWLMRPRSDSIVVGDLNTGYMVAPCHPRIRGRLAAAGEKHRVPCL